MNRARGLNLPLLRRITKGLVGRFFPNQSREIATSFVAVKKMASLNERFFGHEGPTDVITFDYGQDGGEIFICPDVAISQAKEFGTTPQMELVRYIVHGLLHLTGDSVFHAHVKPPVVNGYGVINKWCAAEADVAGNAVRP